jgi:hypothetical protein
MIIYFIVFGILLILTSLDLFFLGSKLGSKSKLFLLSIAGILLLLFSGLRWNTGTDWDNYLKLFNDLDNLPLGETGFEIGYEYLVRFSVLVFNSYTGTLFTVSFIIIFFTYYNLSKYSPYPLLSVLLLFSYSINSSGFGYRQDIAIAILFFSFSFIQKRKLFWFTISIVLATTIHQSAILFFPAYWVYRFKWNRQNIIILSITILASLYIVNSLSSFLFLFESRGSSKLHFYIESGFEDSFLPRDNPYLILLRGIVSRIIFIIIAIIYFVKRKDNDDKIVGVFNLYFFSVLIFLVLGQVSYVFTRFARYYEIFQILLFPLIIKASPKRLKLFFVIIIIIYSTYKFSNIILNDKDIYVPYKTVFFKS